MFVEAVFILVQFVLLIWIAHFFTHDGPVSPGSFKQLLEFWACANCQYF